jgi:histidinol phosphatase-like enzyme
MIRLIKLLMNKRIIRKILLINQQSNRVTIITNQSTIQVQILSKMTKVKLKTPKMKTKIQKQIIKLAKINQRIQIKQILKMTRKNWITPLWWNKTRIKRMIKM